MKHGALNVTTIWLTSDAPDQQVKQVSRPVLIGTLKRAQEVDRSWVVPHNPKGTMMFACHLNGELCISRVWRFKYLFQIDVHLARLSYCRDSCEVDKSTRWWDHTLPGCTTHVCLRSSMSPLRFSIVKWSPPVARLDVHLENHLTLYFGKGLKVQAVVQTRAGTELTEWVGAKVKHERARHLRYVEFL